MSQKNYSEMRDSKMRFDEAMERLESLRKDDEKRKLKLLKHANNESFIQTKDAKLDPNWNYTSARF